MQFSPLLVVSSVIEPLRYYFSCYGEASKLVWDADEKVRTVEISDVNDFNKITLQERPRILVSRGTYQVNKVGLSDNLAEGITLAQGRGLRKDTHMLMYSGTAVMTIEARNVAILRREVNIDDGRASGVHHFATCCAVI